MPVDPSQLPEAIKDKVIRWEHMCHYGTEFFCENLLLDRSPVYFRNTRENVTTEQLMSDCGEMIGYWDTAIRSQIKGEGLKTHPELVGEGFSGYQCIEYIRID